MTHPTEQEIDTVLAGLKKRLMTEEFELTTEHGHYTRYDPVTKEKFYIPTGIDTVTINFLGKKEQPQPMPTAVDILRKWQKETIDSMYVTTTNSRIHERLEEVLATMEREQPKKYNVRCFKRNRDDDGRPGIWIMTSQEHGVFFHGDKDEVQLSRYILDQLIHPDPDFNVEEITTDEVFDILKNWAAGIDQAQEILNRHKLI